MLWLTELLMEITGELVIGLIIRIMVTFRMMNHGTQLVLLLSIDLFHGEEF